MKQNVRFFNFTQSFGYFPQQGFGFEDPDDDIFSNMGLRSRLNRVGHPFDWPERKRAGASTHQSNNPYEQYFDDVDFPHFGSTWDAFNRVGNKRTTGNQQQPQQVSRRDYAYII